MTTIQAALFPLSVQILFDSNACPVRGGGVAFFDAETTTPRAVYRDAQLTSAHTSPVRTDSLGRIPTIWVGLGSYKVVLTDGVGAQIATIDDLPGGTDVTPASAASSGVYTGMVVGEHSTDVPDGWLAVNGKSIGSASSNGSARANADTSALFTKLWNQDKSLVVAPGGRGISAGADFAAAKTIALPDYRGRTLVGVDQMGAAITAGVLSTATTATPDKVGATIGAETVVLTGPQLPAVAPSITINASTHTHAVTLDQQGQHSHGGSTGNNGNHSHGYFRSADQNTIGGSNGSLCNQHGTQANTDPVGDHSHTISADGQHTHNATVDGGAQGGSHAHTVTANNLGSGQAHPNMQPGVLLYWLIKL